MLACRPPELLDLGQLGGEEFGSVLPVAAEVAAEDDGVDGVIGEEFGNDPGVDAEVLFSCAVEVDGVVDVSGLGQQRFDAGPHVRRNGIDSQPVDLGHVRGDRALPAGIGDDRDPRAGRQP